MNPLPRHLIALCAILLPALASAAPLTIDVTTPVPPAKPAPYGPGATTNPQGHSITMDSRSILMDGKPWVPIVGEFHYTRYPRSEWRDELLKMKAGGITVVSTYVFWIHQEEKQGQFDWTGQRSLRDFLLLCQSLGLKAVVRMGPWCHGEVRNGGLPDWVQHSGTKLRSTDPGFMNLVEPLYHEEAKQMQGLLWKDGGPVIAVQLDNECNNAPYLLALKKLAQSEGIDVPYYAITGWQIKVPAREFLPLFGGYADGFWGGTLDKYRKEFFFGSVRATNDLGAQLNNQWAENSEVIAQFPYACAEIGPGMMSSYAKRIKIDPDVVAAMALTKLGCGNNMPGYYMYQGGMNPDSEVGQDHYLEEDHPNFMPLKDYDFQTALGACGEVREQYHLLREQHLFLQDFGGALARDPVFYPDQKPTSLQDFNTLRWDVRSDGISGFLFFSNEQPAIPLPEHPGVQFQVKTAGGDILFPRDPITIPSGAYGIFPINLDCDGVTLQYATAQPLCRIQTGTLVTYFFVAIKGIDPVFALKSSIATQFREYKTAPGSKSILSFGRKGGGSVRFIVLDPDQGRHLWRATFARRDHVILSNATVLTDGPDLRLQSDNPGNLATSFFPAPGRITIGGAMVTGSADGIFTHFTPPSLPHPAPITIGIETETAPGGNIPTLSGTNEAAWSAARVYKLDIPPAAANRHLILNLHYLGNAARLYIGDKLYGDKLYDDHF
jgi:hypothetical protein